jgi:hypothetical protein
MSPLTSVTSITVGAASHEARVAGAEVTWHTVYAGNGRVANGEGPLRVDLVHPIVATLDVDCSPGITELRAGDAVTGFLVDPAHVHAWPLSFAVTLHAPRVHDGGAELLAPPLARGDAIQRITVAGDDDLRFAPDGPALEHHVGYWIAHGLDEREKSACDDRLPGRVTVGDSPIYVGRGDGPVVLRGHLSTAADRARTGAIGVTMISVLVIAVLAWGYRRLTGRARVEQAEAILREEFERTP